jgi:HEAT repeat protein
MRDSEVGPSTVRVFLLVGACLLLVVGLALWFLDWGRSSLPGTNQSHFLASAVPGHIADLKSQDAFARSKAATILWQMGVVAKEATPTLLLVAKDPDPQVREAAVKALGRTGQGTQDAIPVLIKALEDDHAEVRAAAATSLAETWRLAPTGRSGAERAPRGRDNPAASRGEGRTKPAQGPRPTRLAPPYEALAHKAVPLLTGALRDTDARVRACAAEALAETGPLAEPAVPALVQLLQKDTDRSARLQATLSLHNIGPGAKAAVPVLIEKLHREEADGVRVNTAAALGMIRSSPETVVPALVETFLKDEHPDARRCAMMSIGQFGPDAKLALPLLREAAKDPKNQESPATMEKINRLLDFLGKQAQGSGKDRAGELSPPAQWPPPKK